MNERIRELAKNAGFNPYNFQGGNVVLFNTFVELIINECVRIMNEQERLPPGHWHSQSALTHEFAIKKHFGIDK